MAGQLLRQASPVNAEMQVQKAVAEGHLLTLATESDG
jgi:hypothetical protein